MKKYRKRRLVYSDCSTKTIIYFFNYGQQEKILVCSAYKIFGLTFVGKSEIWLSDNSSLNFFSFD